MTDLEKLKALLTEFGVGFEEDAGWPMVGKPITARGIGLYEGAAKVDGYGGFFTRFRFDPDGKFIDVGAWG